MSTADCQSAACFRLSLAAAQADGKQQPGDGAAMHTCGYACVRVRALPPCWPRRRACRVPWLAPAQPPPLEPPPPQPPDRRPPPAAPQRRHACRGRPWRPAPVPPQAPLQPAPRPQPRLQNPWQRRPARPQRARQCTSGRTSRPWARGAGAAACTPGASVRRSRRTAASPANGKMGCNKFHHVDSHLFLNGRRGSCLCGTGWQSV